MTEPKIILSEKELQQCLNNNIVFLKSTRLFATELMDITENSQNFILIITDSQGIILEILGNEEILTKARIEYLYKGICMNENSVSKNAISTAIKEKHPIQITGNEHINKEYRSLTFAASPIFNANNIIVGTLCLAATKEFYHPHTLSLVTVAARAIENKLHNKYILEQLYDAQQYSFSIMNHLSFGLIAINLNGGIHWVNDTACRSLNIRRSRLIEKGINSIYTDWHKLKAQINQGTKILDTEINFTIKNKTESYLLNAYSIKDENKKNIGYVMTFRPFSRMIKLINKFSATQISFNFDQIICKSKIMKKEISYAKTLAKTPSTILITGESGTGKEVFAQSIHSASARKDNSFIAINCGAISSNLIESELFGYEEGAFTGAIKGGRPGKIELAHQGTLFLDEIGEMPLEMQVKLLRSLQEKTITRVGGNKVIKVDIRVIAATNKDLEVEIKKGNFRQDLFYRLSVIPLHLPALRDRKMDIPPLFHYFLSQKANKLDLPMPEIDPQKLKKLVNYSWPGNVRELENMAEKTVIFDGQMIDFPESESSESEDIKDVFSFQQKDKNDLPNLEGIEKQTIVSYLEIFENNISKTAHALDIGRNTLYQKMEKYKISH